MYISAKISYSLEMKGSKGRRINMKKENKRVFLRHASMKKNIMEFRSFHQSSISLSDDFLCSSYPGGMDIRSVKAQNRDVMKIHGRKLIGSIIGSGDTVSAASDRRTAISTEKMRSRRGYEKCQECRMGFTHVYHVL